MGKEPNRLIICNRQTTPYDKECLQVDGRGEQLGSRVFGDCDRLMKLVMKIILGPECEKWENDRDQRIMTYDMARM